MNKDKYIECIFIMIVFIGVFWYSNKKWAGKHRLVNKKLRFSNFTSSVIMSFPYLFIPISVLFTDVLQNLFSANARTIILVSFMLTFTMTPIFNKLMYIPIDKEKYLKQKEKVLENYKGWKYYIFTSPAESLYRMLRLPPWSKRIPRASEYRKWIKSMEDTPPFKIQVILLFITYIITTTGLLLVGYIMDSFYISYVNLYVFPFILIIGLFGQFMFWIINTSGRILTKTIKKNDKSVEIFKFLAFNILYIFMVSIIFIKIIKN